MLGLLRFLIIEKQQELKEVISRLEPFPNLPEFTQLRSVQKRLKYDAGSFTLSQVRLAASGASAWERSHALLMLVNNTRSSRRWSTSCR